MTAVKYSADYNCRLLQTIDLTQSGVKTISLSACPAGVKGSEPEYWAYVSGRGTPEAVESYGGTCAGNGAPAPFSSQPGIRTRQDIAWQRVEWIARGARLPRASRRGILQPNLSQAK